MTKPRTNRGSPLSELLGNLFGVLVAGGAYWYFSRGGGLTVPDAAVYGIHFGMAVSFFMFSNFVQREFEVYSASEHPRFRLAAAGVGSVAIAFLPHFQIYFRKLVLPHILSIGLLPDFYVRYLRALYNPALLQRLTRIWYSPAETVAPFLFVLAFWLVGYLVYKIGSIATIVLLFSEKQI